MVVAVHIIQSAENKLDPDSIIQEDLFCNCRITEIDRLEGSFGFLTKNHIEDLVHKDS